MESVVFSSAAQVIISIIPIVGIVIGGQVVFFYLLWRHKQITILVKEDLYKPARFDVLLFSLLTGMLLTALGAVLTLFFALLDGVSYVVLGGLIPLALGIGLLIFYKVFRAHKVQKQ